MSKYTPEQLRKIVGYILLAFTFFVAALYVLLKWS